MPNYNGSVDRILHDFNIIEKKLNLFELEVDGLRIWHRLRPKVFNQIWLNHYNDEDWTNSQGTTSEKKDDQNTSILRYKEHILRYVKNISTKNPLFSKKNAILFYSGGRRYNHNNEWWEIYLDPIIENSDFRYTLWESSQNFQHYNPAKTSDIKYIDIIRELPIILEKINVYKLVEGKTHIKANKQKLKQVSEEFNKKFGLDMDLVELTKDIIIKRRLRIPIYTKILKILEPKAVVLAWTDHELVESCKNLNITTIKLQKGIRHKYLLKYSYPSSVNKEIFPDYKLVWGDFWKENIQYPLPADRIFSTGFPYLEVIDNHLSNVEESDTVLFISDEDYGESLSKIAVEFSSRTEAEIIYKLHPMEKSNWKDHYPWLVNSCIDVRSQQDSNIYKLLKKCKTQVGVNSTAIIEGFYFGNKTILVNVDGFLKTMEEFIKEYKIPVINESEGLIKIYRENKHRNIKYDVNKIFKRNAIENTTSCINKIIHG